MPQITTEAELYAMRNNPSGIYTLMNDIYMTSYQTGEGWEPIPEFTGTLYGNGFAIHNLYINRPSQERVGLFGTVVPSLGGDYISVDNLRLVNANIVGGKYTGAIAGFAKGRLDSGFVGQKDYRTVSPVYIERCRVTGTIRGAGDYVGGLIGAIGHADGAPLPTWDGAGGSRINIWMRNNHVDVQIFAFGNYVGGLFGKSDGGIRMSGCSTKGAIKSGNNYIGGITGSGVATHSTIIDDCYSTMEIGGNNYLGGLIGVFTQNVNNQTFENCYFAGTMPNSAGKFRGAGYGYGWTMGTLLVDVQKLGFTSTSGDNVNGNTGDSDKHYEYTTAQMANMETYINLGFALNSIWYDSMTSNVDTLQLLSEANQNPFTLQGSGTEADPFQIRTIHNLIAMERYDRQNWLDFKTQIQAEYDWNNPNFRENHNYSAPQRFVYKMMNDIDLGVFPYNQMGWIPLKFNGVESNVIETDSFPFPIYNSIGQQTSNTVTSGVTPNLAGRQYRNYQRGFLGVLDGNGFKLKNLKLSEKRGGGSFIDKLAGGTLRNLTFENVNIDVDRLRNGTVDLNKPETNISVVVSNVVHTSTIERIIIKGQSVIKDYRSDVGGHKAVVAGLFLNAYRLDRLEDYVTTLAGGKTLHHDVTALRMNVNDCHVDIQHTYTNVASGDLIVGFYPLAYKLYGSTIKDCLSTCSKSTVDRFNNHIAVTPDIGILFYSLGFNSTTRRFMSNGISFIDNGDPANPSQTFTPNSTLENVYYNSEIINAVPRTNDDLSQQSGEYYTRLAETFVEGSVEFYGRNTSQLYMQSTFAGWNFTRTWETDGVSYPKLQPYDPNYVEPTNSVEAIVTTQFDELNAIMEVNGITRNYSTRIVASSSRALVSKTDETRKVTIARNTIFEPLFAKAFEYKEPIFGERTAVTSMEPLEFNALPITKKRRNNTVVSAFDELNTSVVATGINRGQFFNSIDIESINKNSILIRVNDPRIIRVEFLNEVYFVGEVKYLTLLIDYNKLVSGNNIVTISGKDQSLFDVYTKQINVNKQVLPYVNSVGRYLIVNNSYFEIINHANDGSMTLSETLQEDVLRVNDNGFNTVELVQQKSTPSFSVGERGHSISPNFVNGQFVKSRMVDGLVEEEYELEAEGEEVVTRVNFERNNPDSYATDTGIEFGFSGFLEGAQMPTLYSGTALTSANLNSLKVIDANQFLINTDSLTSQANKGVYVTMSIDVASFIRQNIDGNYYHDNRKSYDIDFKIIGSQLVRKNGSEGTLRNPFSSVYIWNYDLNQFQSTTTINSASGSMHQHIFEKPGSNSYTRDGVVHIMVQSGRVSSSQQTTNDTATVGVILDFVEFGIGGINMNDEVDVLKKVTQVFIPRDNNSREL